ncbi:N-acetyllactosaminide beta-1 3-N-acetylglucosaminyltransferase 4 [Biomphalaria glabrata]|nr:N-acetyllactosaminide beta-1; 3-N-acetylglucosaminyltransferase 4-like [Biomphalaria glabrata]
MYWHHRLTRKSSILVIVFSAIFVCGIYWSTRHFSNISKNENFESFVAASSETSDEQDEDLPQVSLEAKLKMAIDKLSAKGISPSALMLENLYYIPSEVPYESYNNTILHQPKSCKTQTLLSILVPSNPASIQEREAIRETWGSVARGHKWPRHMRNYDVRVFFVLGTIGDRNLSEFVDSVAEHKYMSQDTGANNVEQIDPINGGPVNDSDDAIETKAYVESIVQQEIKSFDDIIQFDMVDTYANLTRKLLLAFGWLIKSCHVSQFIMKADQDVFVNVPLLYTLLTHYAHTNTIYGHIYPNNWVERQGKWAVDKRTLPVDQYPIYAAGNAYIMSTDAAATVLRLAPYFPYVPVEDAFITGILASVGDVDRIHMSGFTKWSDPLPDECEFINNEIYVGNNATVHDLRIIWWHIMIPNIAGC